jgi:hypothetical protein
MKMLADMATRFIVNEEGDDRSAWNADISVLTL